MSFLGALSTLWALSRIGAYASTDQCFNESRVPVSGSVTLVFIPHKRVFYRPQSEVLTTLDPFTYILSSRALAKPPREVHGGATAYDSVTRSIFVTSFENRELAIFNVTSEEWNISQIEFRIYTNSYDAPVGIRVSTREMFIYAPYKEGQATVNSFFRYNITNGMWSKTANTAQRIFRVRDGGCFNWKTEKFYTFGGEVGGTFYGDFWEFDFNTFAWTHLGGSKTGGRTSDSLTFPGNRYWHTNICDTPGGNMIISGGFMGNGQQKRMFQRNSHINPAGDTQYRYSVHTRKWQFVGGNMNVMNLPTTNTSLGAHRLAPGLMIEATRTFLVDNWAFPICCAPGTVQSSPFDPENACVMCPVGYVGRGGMNSSVCEACLSGYYGTIENCVACAPGTFTAVSAQSTCERCPPGFGSDRQSSSCAECTVGRYSRSDCASCPRGRYANHTQASVCSLCTSGSAAVDYESTACTICAAGTYAEATGASVCTKCALGRFAALNQSSQCTECPYGYFAEVLGSTFCSSCGPEAQPGYWSPLGSSGRHDCVCDDGYYGTPYRSDGTCLPCRYSQGISCPRNSSLPVVQPGFYRSPAKKDLAIACVPKAACSATGKSLTTVCAAGYTGLNCGICTPVTHYRLDDVCEECSFFAAVSLPLFILVIFCALYVNLLYSTPYKGPVYIFLANAFWLQLLHLFTYLDEKWPPLIRGILLLASTFNLNMDLLETECSVQITYWTKWHVKMTAPLLLGAMQLIYFAIQENLFSYYHSILFDLSPKRFILKRLTKVAVWFNTDAESEFDASEAEDAEQVENMKPVENVQKDHPKDADNIPYRFSRYVYAFNTVRFSLFTMLVSTSLEMFQCVRQEDGSYFMAQKMSQHCFDPFWFQMLFTNFFFGLMYSALYIPFKLYQDISTDTEGLPSKESDKIDHFGNFILPYKKERFWWPVAELVNRLYLVLVAKIVVFYAPHWGLWTLFMSILGYTAALIAMRPFKSRTHYITGLAYVSHISALIFRWSAFTLVLLGAAAFPGSAEFNVAISVFVLVFFVLVLLSSLLSYVMEATRGGQEKASKG